MKMFEYGNGFDVVGYGKACNCTPAFNFVSASLGGTTAGF